jgi:hypothetical protein
MKKGFSKAKTLSRLSSKYENEKSLYFIKYLYFVPNTLMISNLKLNTQTLTKKNLKRFEKKLTFNKNLILFQKKVFLLQQR